MDGHDRPRYMISVAAELVGMHPQTLRIYEQKGLVRPRRNPGNTRLYSERDLERLRRRVAGLERRLQEEVANVHRQYRRDLVLYRDPTTTLPVPTRR
jgi:DNA-binding transcriptional MerR regulator